ncbi:hypothetical protein LOTGIDRAFT_161573 [Lottia gigantea]|uniref:Protein kinase domain-containing protein n=1 Tax=Lottia gigantea TaxID=225164 RepID=V4AC14_LOTGI|nr:hypothetical protein LOTGIDRAFT_161573 [Lottia gigantea]ESO94347.1 hypothetical protein LOTGIDRAFT_161573 [Lottia gigantea]
MPRTSAFSTAIRSSNDLIHLEPVNYQCLSSLTVGLNYLYKNSRYGRTKHGRGKTDEKGKYHPCPGEILARRYKILQTLSKQGQSGIILKAQDLYSQTEVTIKVLHVKYYGIGIQEAHLLSTLKTADPYHVSRTVRLLATFKHKEHYCMVFESLHPEPITELSCLTQTTDVTQKLNYIRKLTVKLLQVLSFLQQQNMIHADLKPENILLKDKNDIDSIRVIDFGNAIHHVHQEVSMYYEKFELQTLLYRAPEVMFGIPFGCEVDMWSLGCIIVELFLGTPLFLGENKTELIIEIVDILGPLPTEIFQRGKFYKELSQYTSKHTIKDATLEILNQLTDCYDYTFANFLSGLLKLNPDERLTPLSALQHPFLAPEFNMGVVLKSQGSKDSMFVLKTENYTERPKISPDIKRQNPTSYDLLRLGTTSESCHNIAVVCPFSKSKQGRVSVVPQVSAVPPLIEMPSQRQARSSIDNASSVHGQRNSNQWNSAYNDHHSRRNRTARSNMNLRRNTVQEEELSATSPVRIFTDLQNKQRQHNLHTLSDAGSLNNLQSGSQSPYHISDQNPPVSPTAEVYALSTERPSSSEGDLTAASPRKIRRLSSRRNHIDYRLQKSLNPRVPTPALTVSPVNRHAQIDQAISTEFENVVSQNSETGVTVTKHDCGSNCTKNPRVQMNSFESKDIIELEPTSQATDPQSTELINISDEDPGHDHVEMVTRCSLPSNHTKHINILPVREVSSIKSVSPNVTIDGETAHDVTVIEKGESSDEPVAELIEGNRIEGNRIQGTLSLLNHGVVKSCNDSTERVLTSTPMTGYVKPSSSKLMPKKRLSSPSNSTRNELISPLCSTEWLDSTEDSSKRINQQSHSLCSNKRDMRDEYHQQKMSNHSTSIQTPLCSSSSPIHQSACHLINTNTTSKQSLQTDQNSSEFETIYSSLVQKSSKPDPQPSTSRETRASSTLKRKKARGHCAIELGQKSQTPERVIQTTSASGSGGQKSQTPERVIQTTSASGSCDPASMVIKVEPLDNDSGFQEVPLCSSKIHFLSPLKQEIKEESIDYEVQSNTTKNTPGNQDSPNGGEHEIKDHNHIKEEIKDNEYQETVSRRSECSSEPEPKFLGMKVKSDIKQETDTKYSEGERAPEYRGVKYENESPISRVQTCKANLRDLQRPVKAKAVDLEVKITSPMINDDVSQRSEVPPRRGRASSKALEPNYSGSHIPLAMEMNVGSSESNVYRSTAIRKFMTKVTAQSAQFPSPSSLKVNQSPRRVSKALESEVRSQIVESPRTSTFQKSPARVSGSSLRQFHPKIITSVHGFDSPLLPGREDSSSPESVVFSPQKLKRIENGTIYFEGFDKYISKRELSEKVIKILPETKPKPQRVYSSTESDLSESTASYIRKNIRAKRVQLPRRMPSKVLKQPKKALLGLSTTSNDYEKATASTDQSSAVKDSSQCKEFVAGLATNHRNHSCQKQKPGKRNVQNRAAVKRILKRWKLRKDSSADHSNSDEKHHCQPSSQNSEISVTHMTQRNDQDLNKDTDTGIAPEEEYIVEKHSVSPNDPNMSPNLQEYSWNLLDRDAERQVLEKEWSQIARANNYFGSQAPVGRNRIGISNTEKPSFEDAEVLEDVATIEEEEHDQMTLYSPSHTPVISMTPNFANTPSSPIDYFEICRNPSISEDNLSEIDAIPYASGVKAEIRNLLDQGFDLCPVLKPEHGKSNQRLDSVPYSPTQSPFVLTSTPDPGSIPTNSQRRRSKQRSFVSPPSRPPLDSPRPQRRHKSISQRFVDSGVGQSISPKVSFKFKKPKSCMSNFKRRQLSIGTSESESIGCSDLSEVSSPGYSVSNDSSSSFAPSSGAEVAYSPSQEPVLSSSQTIERKRKFRSKPKMCVSELNTLGTCGTNRHLGASNRNRHSQISDELNIEPDDIGTPDQIVTPERQWQRNLRRRDTIPRLDRSDPNVALYGAFVYFAKKLS